MKFERCETCGGKLYRDEGPLAHEFSGRCLSRPDLMPKVGGTRKVKTLATLKDEGYESREAPKPKRTPKPRVRKEVVCGTRAMYNRGCRCELCTAAQLEYSRAYSARAGSRERYLAYKKVWVEKNRDKVAKYRQKERSKKEQHEPASSNT